MSKTSHVTPFGLRMTPDLKKWIKARAASEDRSQHYVIIQLLESAKKAEKAGSSHS